MKTKFLVFLCLVILSCSAVSATIRWDTQLTCNGEWESEDVHCSFYQPSIKCDNYMGLVVYFQFISASMIEEKYNVFTTQRGITKEIQIGNDGTGGGWAVVSMDPPPGCFDYSSGHWIDFNKFSTMSGTIDFELKREFPDDLTDYSDYIDNEDKFFLKHEFSEVNDARVKFKRYPETKTVELEIGEEKIYLSYGDEGRYIGDMFYLMGPCDSCDLPIWFWEGFYPDTMNVDNGLDAGRYAIYGSANSNVIEEPPPIPPLDVFKGTDKVYDSTNSSFIESYDNIHGTNSILKTYYSNPLKAEYYGDSKPPEREYNDVIAGWKDGKELSRQKYEDYWYWVTYPAEFYSLECTYGDKKDCACEQGDVRCTFCNSMGFWEQDKSILENCEGDTPACENAQCVGCIEGEKICDSAYSLSECKDGKWELIQMCIHGCNPGIQECNELKSELGEKALRSLDTLQIAISDGANIIDNQVNGAVQDAGLCVLDAIPNPMEVTDKGKGAELSWEFLEYVLKSGVDSVETAYDVKVSPVIEGNILDTAELDDTILINANGDYLDDVENYFDYIYYASDNYAEELERIIYGYNNNEFAINLVSIAGGIAISAVTGGSAAPVMILALEKGLLKGSLSCLMSGVNLNSFATTMISAEAVMIKDSIDSSENIENTMKYLIDKYENEDLSFPDIEVIEEDTIKVKNIYDAPVNISVLFEGQVAIYHNCGEKTLLSKTPVVYGVEDLLMPGEEKEYVFEVPQEILDNVNSVRLSDRCLFCIYGDMSVFAEKSWKTYVFYGEEGAMALKTRDFVEHEIKLKNYDCFEPKKKSGGGGGSSKKKVQEENDTKSNYSVVEVSENSTLEGEDIIVSGSSSSSSSKSSSSSSVDSEDYSSPITGNVVSDGEEVSVPAFFTEVKEVFSKLFDFFKGLFH